MWSGFLMINIATYLDGGVRGCGRGERGGAAGLVVVVLGGEAAHVVAVAGDGTRPGLHPHSVYLN